MDETAHNDSQVQPVFGRYPLPGSIVATQYVEGSVGTAFEAEVSQLQKALGGTLGFAARHLQSGLTVGVNAEVRFPMASTFKIAIAAAALALVDQGRLRLDQMVSITPEHCLQTGEIGDGLVHPGISLSLGNLVEIMLVHSNNNATDRVLECVGGTPIVNAWLRRIGVEDMRVDRTVNGILNDFFGFEADSPSVDTFIKRYPSVAEQAAIEGVVNTQFDEDPRDSATPAAMVELLCKVFSGDALQINSRTFLLETMARCRTGAARIKGLLPLTASVAHKTGTIGGTINDAGIVTLPDGGGHFALTVFIKGSDVLPISSRERAVSEVARSVYDFYRLR